MKTKPTILNGLLIGSALILTSCAATQTMLEHGTLEVNTKQSHTIFLDPVHPSEKTIYLSLKNTSDQDIELTPQLKEALRDKGYRLLNNHQQAHYLLQANILKVGKMSISAAQAALGGGYGSALAGGVAATAATSAFTNSGDAMLVGGLIGGVVGLAADSLIKDVNYSMITDVQISERVGKGIKVQEEFNADLKNGRVSTTKQVSNKTTNYQRYRTRIVSNADKVNLQFKEARPALERGLVKALAGIF